MDFDFLDVRPLIVALAGSNGAGKTTFYHSHLADTGLRFVNADQLARELDLDPYDAADMAAAVRQTLVAKQESFAFETVLSDPVGEKVKWLREAVNLGYQVVLIFIRIPDVESSIQRALMRVASGGHDVPDEKLRARFDRTQGNLRRAINELPHVLVFDNSDLSRPFRLVAAYRDGKPLKKEAS